MRHLGVLLLLTNAGSLRRPGAALNRAGLTAGPSSSCRRCPADPAGAVAPAPAAHAGRSRRRRHHRRRRWTARSSCSQGAGEVQPAQQDIHSKGGWCGPTKHWQQLHQSGSQPAGSRPRGSAGPCLKKLLCLLSGRRRSWMRCRVPSHAACSLQAGKHGGRGEARVGR